MPVDYEKMRGEALSRANIASRLVTKKYYKDVVIAIRARDKDAFEKVCTSAGLGDTPEEMDLVQHMWKVINAAHAEVYGGQAPGPIW